MNDQPDLLPIGRFARLAGLTHRALRHYDELGLLPPALVDDATGRRYYTAEQLRTAETIVALRVLELPLEEVAAVLSRNEALLRETLTRHRERLVARAAETQRVLTHLDDLLEGRRSLVPEPDDVLYRIELETLPDQQVLSIRDRVHQEEARRFAARALEDLTAHAAAAGADRSGTPYTVLPFADEEGFVELEVALPVEAAVPGAGRIESRLLPGGKALVLTHEGLHDNPALAYRALAHCLELEGATSAGDPREYAAEAGAPRIAWPVELPHDWRPSEEKFERPLPAPVD
jgi:DNA-binding transcriptional MerR regulator